MTRRDTTYLALAISIPGLILVSAIEFGLRWNTTASMPFGLWRVSPLSSPPAVGVIILFCMNDPVIARLALNRGYLTPGRCSNGTEPLLKPVAAVAGDLVLRTAAGISINGSLQRNTAALTRDPAGRPLPQLPLGEYRVTQDQVWVLSSNTPLSFDSRYYGGVPLTDITGIARPVFVFDSEVFSNGRQK